VANKQTRSLKPVGNSRKLYKNQKELPVDKGLISSKTAF